MMGVRKLLDFFFTKPELKILDDILPEFKRHEKLNDEEKALEDGKEEEEDEDLAKRRQSIRYTQSGIELPMANGNVMKIPMSSSSNDDYDINISEEMNKSGVWKSLDGSGTDLSNTAG